MYRFSLASFLRLFQHALQNKDVGNTDLRIRALTMTLQTLVYEYVCRLLFKADRLMFAMHLVHGMHPSLFQDLEWEAFIGQLVPEMFRRQESIKKMRDGLPSWCDSERTLAVNQLQANFPTLYNNLDLGNTESWTTFSRSSHCDCEIPPNVLKRITSFQQVLVIPTLRPDRLQSAMEHFTTRALGLKEISPATLNFKRLYTTDTLPTELILIVISPGLTPLRSCKR